MDKPIKITIEGFTDESVILEGIQNIAMIVEYSKADNTTTVIRGNPIFIGFAAAKLLSEMKNDEEDGPCLM